MLNLPGVDAFSGDHISHNPEPRRQSRNPSQRSSSPSDCPLMKRSKKGLSHLAPSKTWETMSKTKGTQQIDWIASLIITPNCGKHQMCAYTFQKDNNRSSKPRSTETPFSRTGGQAQEFVQKPGQLTVGNSVGRRCPDDAGVGIVGIV